jgi:cell division septation protein DedD
LPTVKGRYSIQIRAFQEESKARAYMEGLTAYKKEVVLHRAVDGSGRVWHRILLGRFRDRDAAAAFMKDKKILNLFPGSFIQQTDRRG